MYSAASINIDKVRAVSNNTHVVCEHLAVDTAIIRVAVSEISDAFQLTESEFMTQYGFSKPAKDTRIVLYCRSGRRSKSACKILTDGGYGKYVAQHSTNDLVAPIDVCCFFFHFEYHMTSCCRHGRHSLV